MAWWGGAAGSVGASRVPASILSLGFCLCEVLHGGLMFVWVFSGLLGFLPPAEICMLVGRLMTLNCPRCKCIPGIGSKSTDQNKVL